MKPRRRLIADMLDVHARVDRMHAERRAPVYSSTELATALGHRLTHAEGVALTLIGWRRVIRLVDGRRTRAWLPPGPFKLNQQEQSS